MTFPAWTTTRCAAASRPATSRSGKPWRSWPATPCRRSRSVSWPTAAWPMPAALARCSPAHPGVRGMAGGQAVDLASVGATLAQPELESMHRMKTGALIRASVRLGSACGRPLAEGEAAALDAYAAAAGLAFQVVDDVLDVEGSAVSLGKTAGKDVAQGKPTFVTCLGLPAARTRAEALAGRSPRRARPVRRAPGAGSPSSPTGSYCGRTDAPDPRPGPRPGGAAPPRSRRAPAARARAAGVPADVGGADGRAPVVQPRHRRAHDRAALRVRHAARPHRLGRRPPDLRAQDPDRPARRDGAAADGRRAVGFSAALGKRIRHLWHRALVDVDFGGARHGGRREAQGRERAASSR